MIEEKETEIVSVVFGKVDLRLPKKKESINSVRKLLDLLEHEIQGHVRATTYTQTHQDAPGRSEPALNVPMVQIGAVRQPDAQGAIEESELKGIPVQPKTGFLLVPKFDWDKSKEKHYRTIFFFEHEDGRVMIWYANNRVFTTKESVMAIPFPIPYKYVLPVGLPVNKRTAIRQYREYLFNEARNHEVRGAVNEQEEKDAAEKREDALRQKAELNKARWEAKRGTKGTMSERTKELRKAILKIP